LFDLSRPLDDLADMLLNELAGETATMMGIYMRHMRRQTVHLPKLQDALIGLESQNRIKAVRPAGNS